MEGWEKKGSLVCIKMFFCILTADTLSKMNMWPREQQQSVLADFAVFNLST